MPVSHMVILSARVAIRRVDNSSRLFNLFLPFYSCFFIYSSLIIASAIFFFFIRRFECELGGPHRRTPRLGPWVSSSEDSLHQPERASSSSVRPEGRRTPVGGPIGSSILRQHHHASVCPSPAAIHHGLVQCHSGRSQSPHMVIGLEWTLHQEVVDQLVHNGQW